MLNYRSGSNQPAKTTWVPTSPADKAPQVCVRFGNGAGRNGDIGEKITQGKRVNSTNQSAPLRATLDLRGQAT